METKRYIITGAPGAGKSTLLQGLQQAGYHCSAEVSRRLIIQEIAQGSNCLPWLDIPCFSAKVIQEMIVLWHSDSAAPLTFFDRGIADVIAYLKVANLPVPPAFLHYLEDYPYQRQAFILPPWEAIFVNDSERWQTFDEAVAIDKAIRETYTEAGYQLLDVPQGTQEERVAFVLSAIKY